MARKPLRFNSKIKKNNNKNIYMFKIDTRYESEGGSGGQMDRLLTEQINGHKM